MPPPGGRGTIAIDLHGGQSVVVGGGRRGGRVCVCGRREWWVWVVGRGGVGVGVGEWRSGEWERGEREEEGERRRRGGKSGGVVWV